MFMGEANRDFAVRKLDELSARAVELDPQDPLAWQLWGVSASRHGDHATLRERVERALSLGPNNTDLLVLAASDAALAGFSERGPELADRALRLNPHHPHWWDVALTPAYFLGGEFARAHALARKLGQDSPMVAAYQAMIAGELGKTDEAAAAVAAVVRLDPEWRVEAAFFNIPMERDRAFVAESARKAGLPVCMTAAQIKANPPGVLYEECELERAKAATN
jgi:tetratricopeptide (TPR) repeat protein